jgi:4-oxalocrotonate tautomerase
MHHLRDLATTAMAWHQAECGRLPSNEASHAVRPHCADRAHTDGRRTQMPLVTVKVIEGVFTPKQKQEMIGKITETMVEIEGESLRPVTWVLVEEVRSGEWGIGGNGLTTADVHALQQQPAAVSG